MGTQQILQQSSVAELTRPQAGLADEQPRRLQIALVLLLVALAFVIVKDRDFWFGSDDAIESDATGAQTIQNATAAVPVKTAQASVARTAAAKNHVTKKTATPAVIVLPHQDVAQSDSPVVTTSRAALPSLDVEVIAGDNHRTIRAGSNVAKVQIPSDSNRVSAVSSATLTTNAAQHERLSTGSFPEIRQTVDTTYPLLGQHMRVQGSVVLQAVVGTDGNIEDLRVLSGPAILTAAAQQAVRQWRFKPYLQNGQPVETKARITVNFSIKIADDSANAS
jgi:TonB family protein